MTLESERSKDESKTELDLPRKTDSSVYSLDALFDDQKQVIAYVLKKIMEWLSHLEYDNKGDLSDFKPLHLMIIGAAGTGKSVVINTLVTVICKIFGVTQ